MRPFPEKQKVCWICGRPVIQKKFYKEGKHCADKDHRMLYRHVYFEDGKMYLTDLGKERAIERKVYHKHLLKK